VRCDVLLAHSYLIAIRYEGEWKEKELDGYGIELWSDGEEYEGWSTQGRLNGYGRASYTSGTELIPHVLFPTRAHACIVTRVVCVGDQATHT
jgi:hypothetical protein